MRLQRERAHDLVREIAPLTVAHHAEVAPFRDIALAPNIEAYCAMEDAGCLRCYTLRDDELAGYAVYVTSTNPHYVTSRQANNDLLYVRPDRRGHSLSLLRFAERSLAEEGVDIVYQSVARARDFSRVLVWLGYEHIESLFAKPLRREAWAQQPQ